MAQVQQIKIDTSHGTLAVQSIGSGSPPLLCIHGNSFCCKIFKHIFSSDLSKTHQVLTIDLPGHGESSNALDPQRSYNQPAYADAAVQVLQKLGIAEVIIFGWSLGGHIAIEMLPLFDGIKGIMICGTPPVGYGELDKGFTFGDEGWKIAAAARDGLNAEEISGFAHNCADPPYEDWMEECVARTDQVARSLMFNGFARGECLDQRKTVGRSTVPIAVVNGADEPFVNLQFVKDVEYGNLWSGKCIEMEGLLHAPFWAKPKEFQEILERFIKDVS
ncbi:alpha/beta hydrolase fold protein [Tothia fuscella]|uniref:Alpha/beta hydrolase fold protein n=1 Tax=Tothia fuscella TaxID=1048955 RepID=A0A9P4TV14_9PEZI|nr:alpha/beta hydrolase fold protein [Tothia fuscella]